MHRAALSFFKSHSPELNKEFELYRYPKCGPDIERYVYKYLRYGSMMLSAKTKGTHLAVNAN